MASFTETLKNLFSTKLIITRTQGNRLKVVDLDKIQATPTDTRYARSSRWKRNTITGWGMGDSQTEIEALRRQLYLDYEAMEGDAIVYSALDVYADESTTVDDNGYVLSIKTQDEKVKKVLYNLFYDILDIDFTLWKWVRTTCKYGDFFLILDVHEGIGVVRVLPVHPAVMQRRDVPHPSHPDFPYSTTFIVDDSAKAYFSKSEYEFHEVAHFRLSTDPNFEPYGKSVIEGARKDYKRLSLLEDAMLLHRIMRAPERRVFKIDVGNIAPEEVEGYIEDIANTMKKVPFQDPATGEYDLKFNVKNMMEDYFLPVRGGDSGTDIDTLSGLSNEGQIDDVEYIRNKMMASFKIPKAYLGYDEDVEGKATLAAEDIRFARTIERIQKILVSELYKIALIHLKAQGFSNEQLMGFELSLNNPSLIHQRQKIDLLNQKVELMSSIFDKRLFSRKYVYENIVGMTPQEMEQDQELIIKDLERQFREEQIASEGNDPVKSGTSRGTPHDIAAMHATSKYESGDTLKRMYTEDERQNNPGRPPKVSTFGRHKDRDFGRDPFGDKRMSTARQGNLEWLEKLGTKKALVEQADDNPPLAEDLD